MGGMQPNFEEFLRQRNPLEEVMLGGPRAQQITQFGSQDLSMLTPAFLQALLSGGGGTQTLGFSPGGISGPMSANQIIAQGQTSAAPVSSPILAALSGTAVPTAPGAIRGALELLLGGGAGQTRQAPARGTQVNPAPLPTQQQNIAQLFGLGA